MSKILRSNIFISGKFLLSYLVPFESARRELSRGTYFWRIASLVGFFVRARAIPVFLLIRYAINYA